MITHPLPAPSEKKSAHWGMPAALIGSLVMLILYIYLDYAGYMPGEWLKPLPGTWNDNIIYTMILIGALMAAGAGILWTNNFEKQEPPHRVWLFFTIGWGCWVLGELLGFVYRQAYNYEPPALTFEDICWTAGYIFFSLALFMQYRILYARRKKVGVGYFIAAILVIWAVTGLLTWLAWGAGLGEEGNWLSLFTSILYPLCDLTQGIAALWLAFLFGKGRWVRPWWGLIAFALADGIYTWYWIFNPTFLSTQLDALISTFADTAYFLAYIIVALGLLSNSFHITHGLARRVRASVGLAKPVKQD